MWASKLLGQGDKEDKGRDGIGSEIQLPIQRSFEGKVPRHIWDRHQNFGGGKKIYMEGMKRELMGEF